MSLRKPPLAAARRARLQAWIDDHFGGNQAEFLRDAALRGHRINQGELSALLRDKSFGEKRAATLEEQAAMPAGYLVNPEQQETAASEAPKAKRPHGVAESVAAYAASDAAATMQVSLDLLDFDEEHGGRYRGIRRARRLLELHARVVACGGAELSDAENARFEDEVRERERRAENKRNADGRASSGRRREGNR